MEYFFVLVDGHCPDRTPIVREALDMGTLGNLASLWTILSRGSRTASPFNGIRLRGFQVTGEVLCSLDVSSDPFA
jgi:hypothetical protein